MRVHNPERKLASGVQPATDSELGDLVQRVTDIQRQQHLGQQLGVLNRGTAKNILAAARRSVGPVEITNFIKRSPRVDKWQNWAVVTTAVGADLMPWLRASGWPDRDVRSNRLHAEISTAAPAPPSCVEEPGTLWAQIKTALQCYIETEPASGLSKEAFANWIGPSRYSHMEGENLIVTVPDQITKEFLETEYKTEIARVVGKLNLPVARIDYRVQGGM